MSYYCNSNNFKLMKYGISNNFGHSNLEKNQFFQNLPFCVTQKTSFLTSKFSIFSKFCLKFLISELIFVLLGLA